ncbi:ABC transporter permease [[Mycoplasma] testudinis]|uniref:ABC transporter permease n=1 Tax=[Mycoplasma] testudinis TaxID=33924 RepID=UPI000698B272|nr:ABC transporter permease [[Mycoplasma] testudinis]
MWGNLKSKFSNTFKAKKKIWLILPFVGFMIMLFIVPLIIILVYSLQPVTISNLDGSKIKGTVADNFNAIDAFVGEKIWKSFWIAVVSTALCLIIAFPFCYYLAFGKSKVFKATVILFATAPIWSSFLIKLIGLKSILDLLVGGPNTTFGDGFTIIGMVYIYIPFMILPLYTVLSNMPKTYMTASQDLGRNAFTSFFLIVVPYCKGAIISGLTLVLLPSFTTVAIPEFLNNRNDSALIGDFIFSLGSNGLQSNLAIAQASAVSLVLALIILGVYVLWVGVPKMWRMSKAKISTGSFFGKKKNTNVAPSLVTSSATFADTNLGDNQ